MACSTQGNKEKKRKKGEKKTTDSFPNGLLEGFINSIHMLPEDHDNFITLQRFISYLRGNSFNHLNCLIESFRSYHLPFIASSSPGSFPINRSFLFKNVQNSLQQASTAQVMSFSFSDCVHLGSKRGQACRH